MIFQVSFVLGSPYLLADETLIAFLQFFYRFDPVNCYFAMLGLFKALQKTALAIAIQKPLRKHLQFFAVCFYHGGYTFLSSAVIVAAASKKRNWKVADKALSPSCGQLELRFAG